MKVRGLNLFKFTDELQFRLKELSAKKKADLITAEEDAELTGLLELDRIFTLLNARVIAESCHTSYKRKLTVKSNLKQLE